jgi:glycyl-tRNA synthetase
MVELTIEEMTMFCKRKGFVFPSGEIYGGLAGFWDFGPLGTELKKNIKEAWWRYHIYSREDILGIDGSIITHPSVWKASGHVDSFVDLAVVCKKCKNKSKVDKHELETTKCEKCGGFWESKGEFNPMFTTQVGPVKEDSSLAYLRPETAQLIFADFKQITDTCRIKLPFGIAQIGKSFRNEIAPRNFLFRCREFEQMEIEYFIDPEKKKKCPYNIPDMEIIVYSAEMQEKNKESKKMKISEALKKGIIMLPWHAYWLATELSWFKSLGVNMENFRIRQHMKNEKSHYATDTWDIEYNFPFGFKELEGIADRGTFDLTQHQKISNKSLEIREEESGKKFLPMVISEPSLGVERAFLVFLFDAYAKNQKGEIVLKLHPKLSPIKASVFPLIKKDNNQEEIAREVYRKLKEEWNVSYDDSGSVGRRYARNDEIGTPYCITIDEESKKDNSVTIRDRNTTKQIRVPISEVKETIRKLLSQEIDFEKAGKLV